MGGILAPYQLTPVVALGSLRILPVLPASILWHVMGTNPTPPTTSSGLEQVRVLEMLGQQSVTIALAQLDRNIQNQLDMASEPDSPGLRIRLEARAQIIDWLGDAVLTSIERSISARAVRSKEPLRQAFRRLINRHSPAIWQHYERNHGKQPTDKKLERGPSLEDFDRWLRNEHNLAFPDKGLATQLNPTLDDIDVGNRRRAGNLAKEHLSNILIALGEEDDLDSIRQLENDTIRDGLLESVISEVNKTIEISQQHGCLICPEFVGRYELDNYKTLLQQKEFTDRTITLHFCEAERLYIVDCLNATKPVHPLQCAAIHHMVDGLHGSWPCAMAMPDLDQDLFNRWCLAWKQTANQRLVHGQATSDTVAMDGGADYDSYVPTPGLPVPPIGTMELVVDWLCKRLPRALSEDEVRQVVTALVAEHDNHGIVICLSYDDSAVLSEALLQRALRPDVPLPEMAMIACILGKVGLPWLPPIGPILPVHIRQVAVAVVAGAAGLQLEPPPASGRNHPTPG